MSACLLIDSESVGVQTVLQLCSNLNGEDTSALAQKGSSLVAEGKNADAAKLLMENASVLLQKASDKDVEASFVVIFSVLQRLSTSESSPLIQQAATLLSSNKDEKTVARITSLAGLFNSIPRSHPEFLSVLTTLIQYAKDVRRTDTILRSLKGINELLLTFEKEPTKQRRIYHILSELLRDTGRTAESIDYKVKYLSTFPAQELSSSNPAAISSMQEATRLILEIISMPTFFLFDSVYELPQVAAMRANPAAIKNSDKILQLLDIFSQGTVSDFLSFSSANAALLETEFNMPSESLLRKMRSLSLCSLGPQVSELSYATLAERLALTEEEVELAVIRAVGSGVVDAKLDQIRRVVTFSRTHQRLFTSGNWKEVSTYLQHWQNSVAGLLKSIEAAKRK